MKARTGFLRLFTLGILIGAIGAGLTSVFAPSTPASAAGDSELAKAGILVSPTSGLKTSEGGGSDSFTIQLQSRPKSPVEIQISTSDSSEGVASPEKVAFYPVVWYLSQQVVVTGVNDLDPGGDVAYQIFTAPASSGDKAYAGLDAEDVTAANADDEAAPQSTGLSAAGDSDTTSEDKGVTTEVLKNDSGLDFPPFTLTIPTPAEHGAAHVNPDKSITYTPDQDFNGSDFYNYQVCDSVSQCSTARVDITIGPLNDAPVAGDDVFGGVEDVPLTLDVLANDRDVDSDGLSIAAVTQPVSGSAIVIEGRILYTPALDFFGTVNFTYTVSDGDGGADLASVTVTLESVPEKPAANDDAAKGLQGRPLIIPVLANDTDPEDRLLNLEEFDALSSQGGSVARDTAGTADDFSDDRLVYTPPAGFLGPDSFQYSISNGAKSDTAVVSVEISASAEVPIANDDIYHTYQDGERMVPSRFGPLSNDTSPLDSEMRLILLAPPKYGQLELDVSGSGSFRYLPNPGFSGQDRFTYQAAQGANLSGPAAVVLDVLAASDHPVAGDDLYSVDAARLLSAAPPGVLSNDYDLGAGSLQAVLLDGPDHGSLALEPDGSFTYTPAAGYVGSDSFTYRARSSTQESNKAWVEINLPDLEPPTLNWVAPPTDNDNRYDVAGETIQLVVAPSDNIAIDRVYFYRWDAINNLFMDIGIIYSPPYQLDLDPRNLNMKWNEVFAKAYDTAGNVSERKSIFLYQPVPKSLLFLPILAH